jgi:hypothetical protein
MVQTCDLGIIPVHFSHQTTHGEVFLYGTLSYFNY